jgi:group I intron endonuclease
MTARQISGIYQITNITNKKCYIGLSRNICARWRQHTFRVQEDEFPKSRIRAAFKKYGLKEIVNKPGIHGQFEFIVLEECSEEQLFEREKYWIERLQPEYNCNLDTLPQYYQGNHKRIEKQQWVQYHNYEKENGYPANEILETDKKVKIRDSHHYISSKKRALLYTQGDTIYLIIGIGRRLKSYFLWTRTIVEQIDFLEEEDLLYNAIGEQYFLDPPPLLNSLDGFQEFFFRCGHFGLGLLNIANFEFAKKLEVLSAKYRLHNESVLYKDYIKKFEKIYSLN